eukprot:RCo011239
MVAHLKPGTSLAEFRRALRSHAVAVVEFFTRWSPPCVDVAGAVEQLAKRHPAVAFVMVDVDKCAEISVECNVTVMPTFVVFRGGSEVGRITGPHMSRVAELLQQAAPAAPAAPSTCAHGGGAVCGALPVAGALLCSAPLCQIGRAACREKGEISVVA